MATDLMNRTCSLRVIVHADLAALYGVETRLLVEAVKRNWRAFSGWRESAVISP
jgi:hypothetical protein